MAFVVEDLRDLIELLRLHPEWRQQLWSLLATEELLRLPAEFQNFRDQTFESFRKTVEKGFQRVDEQIVALVETQRRTEESLQRLNETFSAHRKEFLELREEFLAYRVETDRRFAELAEAQRRTEEGLAALRQEFLEHRSETERRFAELAETVRRLSEAFTAHREEFLAYRAETDRRFSELAEAQRRHYEEFVAYRAETEHNFAELWKAVHALTRDVSVLKRNDLERQYRERAASYFGRPDFRKVQALSAQELTDALADALDAGVITPEDYAEARRVDLVIRGQWKDRPLHLALEVSWVLDRRDIERAVRRARILQNVLGETWPAVAGRQLTRGAREEIRRLRQEGQPVVVASNGVVDWP